MSQAAIDDLLSEVKLGHLGLLQGSQPHVVPVQFAYEAGAVWVHSLEGEKVRLMRDNPEVCLQVEKVEGKFQWQSAIVWGRFEELKGEDVSTALGVLARKLLPPGTPIEGDPFAPPGLAHRAVFFRVPVTRKAGKFAMP